MRAAHADRRRARPAGAVHLDARAHRQRATGEEDAADAGTAAARLREDVRRNRERALGTAAREARLDVDAPGVGERPGALHVDDPGDDGRAARVGRQAAAGRVAGERDVAVDGHGRAGARVELAAVAAAPGAATAATIGEDRTVQHERAVEGADRVRIEVARVEGDGAARAVEERSAARLDR